MANPRQPDDAGREVATHGDDGLPSTGERFIPGLGGAIELEHLHRYHFAAQACAGKTVLDIACGEGYGSSILARTARSVVGVDIADEAVEHARRHYAAPTLSFEVGDCAAIPLDDASFDVVVSFETIEHHDRHQEMMREIRRVLKPGGLLVMSSPEKFEYSDRPGTTNEFHVHELYRDEFIDLVRSYFGTVEVYDQKVMFGSAILSESRASRALSLHAEEGETAKPGLVRPVYLIAVASDGPVEAFDTGVFEQALEQTSEWRWWIDTVDQRDATIRQVDADRSALHAQIEAQRDQFIAQRAQMEALQAQLAPLAALQTRLISLQDSFETHRDRLAQDFAMRVEQLQQHHRAVEAALRGEMTAQATTLGHRLSNERATAVHLRHRLAEIGAELARRAGEHADAIARNAALADEASAVHERHALELAERDGQLAERDRQLAEVDRNLAEHASQIADRDAQLAHSARVVDAERAARLAIYASTSWRISAPIRRAKDLLRVLSGRGPTPQETIAPATAAPTQAAQPSDPPKPRTRRFGFAPRRGAPETGRVATVRERHDEDPGALARSVPEPTPIPTVATGEAAPIPQLIEDVVVMTEPRTLEPTYSASGASLWVADGTREWADLATMRDRIAAFEAARLAAVVPDPIVTTSVAGHDLGSVADGLCFAPSAAPKATILIPAFNHVEMTLECLQSIANARTDVAYEIVIADDASTDATSEVLARVRNVTVHRNAENLHFLRNCNAALPLARGDYVVFLNNDVQVRDGWLDEMLRVFEAHENVGAVGPKIVYPSGYLQEAGVAFNTDLMVDMVGVADDPALPRYNYARRVDYASGACLAVPRALVQALGGFDDALAPAYCEDADLCLRIRERGLSIWYAPDAVVVHRLSATTASDGDEGKRQLVARNLATMAERWQPRVEAEADVRTIAFYLPQFYPFAENDHWWGKGFTEWTNVAKAQPNFVGHYQPHLPADLGFYDLRVAKTMEDQVALARRYGLGGFCFYYYWFAGKRLLDLPIERMLETGKPDFPFCLCWANENWTRRWDGQDTHVLMAQSHSDADDEAVILDLIRYFRSPSYIRIDGRPLLMIYRVTLFPDFAKTAAHWRRVCREQGIGEIYLSLVESFELVSASFHPSQYGCDATVEFPPQGLAETVPPSGAALNPDFTGHCVDYRSLALRYCNRPLPAYTRFRGAMPGWDNTPRRQNNSYCIEHATPGGFQAWLEHIVDDTRKQHFGDERIVFVNAWNEWAEGAHLEPDRRFGHTYLEALRNAKDRQSMLRLQRHAI